MDIISVILSRGDEKLAYTDRTETEFINKTINAESNSSRIMDSSLFDYFKEGQSYVVTINGTKYERTCYYVTDGGWCIGNAQMHKDNYEDNGDSFCIFKTATGGLTHLYANDPNTHDISVSRAITVKLVTETIHPIDPKYIPGAVLPVVEITTAITVDGAELTAEEAAKLDSLNGMPCIIKTNQNGIVFNVVANFDVLTEDMTNAYLFTIMGSEIAIFLVDGAYVMVPRENL